VLPAAPFPWDEVLCFLLAVLRLAPDAAWALTLREIGLLLCSRPGGPAPPRLSDLARLSATYPDGVAP
jgi:uncharacterized phage protein (TIGR02216 family)